MFRGSTSGQRLVVAAVALLALLHGPALAQVCGNGVVESGEQCDPGPDLAGDCCSASCQLAAAGVQCRPAAGPCDVPETCTGTGPACPADGVSSSAVVCRAVADPQCDVEELCDGSSVDCPADVVVPDGTSCVFDGDACTEDVCQAGLCAGEPNFDACLDDFLCYRAPTTKGTPKPVPVAGVQLADQFEDLLLSVEKGKLLCAPADKNGEGTVDAATHLRARRLRAADTPFVPVPAVTVRNQFGDLTVDLRKRAELLVPSSKGVPSGPFLPPPDPLAHDVDHFKCYKARVTSGTPKLPPTQVSVTDQFTATPKVLDVKSPRLLCTPVDKNGEGLKKPDRHLMCFKVKPAAGEPAHTPQLALGVNGQFGSERVDTRKESMLCVPSEKFPTGLPACGDGVREGPEECDGVDDAACPSLCDAACTCPRLLAETRVVASEAEPANTPGTAGVTVTDPKLLTQFGGLFFSLNNATYTRFYLSRPLQPPAAILILVPGFEGGAGNFRILAENLLLHALADHGLAIELWGYDRRTHQLEDRVGLDIAETVLDPSIGLDWLFGTELGLTLHPALVAGPNRRAMLYVANANEIPFLANWTNLVFSQDIDAVVTAAHAAVGNGNVFLGGHSAGTGFTARYAATDFNLSGVGPADPGYARLRGLVLLEGGGGSVAGPPLTADSLDRIEAKFDGGLFGAVRDAEPRCVDGTTVCTIATEAVDCVGQVPPKCTLSTTEFATGLLNPSILASVEPVAIQGATDPDGGQNILQVDQGAPGNSAVAVVPDLFGLSLLPASTVMGGIAQFLDDDGGIAASFTFLATSLGAPGPVVGGLRTWLDITEGPLPPAVLPYNGPPPMSLPGGRWGQEKEVTDFTRLMPVFFVGGTNFTDWYYPNAGPATTSAPGVCSAGTCVAGNVGAGCANNAACAQAIDLDSSALSIGRGRRDIENLTQAPGIDVPVICFGGTNGLTPVPASFLGFASSIGTCTAPSCDGTARVVDASLPNPAFPTFGSVNGGFEVYLSEGFAHVDVITADDGPDNNVIVPLAAFLARNVQ